MHDLASSFCRYTFDIKLGLKPTTVYAFNHVLVKMIHLTWFKHVSAYVCLKWKQTCWYGILGLFVGSERQNRKHFFKFDSSYQLLLRPCNKSIKTIIHRPLYM